MLSHSPAAAQVNVASVRMQWRLSEHGSWDSYSPCSWRSKRHIFISASERIISHNFTDEQIRSHYSNPYSMASQLTQLTPCSTSSFYQPCFKGYWDTCLTHLLLTFFINSSRSQIGATPLFSKLFNVFHTFRIKFKFSNTAYSPNYLVLIIYLSSFVFQLYKNIYSSPIHSMSIRGAPTTCFNIKKFTEARTMSLFLCCFCSL